MRYAGRILALLTLFVASVLLVSCGQSQNCSGISFGSTGSGGGSTGGLNSGGSVCGSGNNGNGNGSASALLYYVSGGPVIAAAGITTNTFANVNGYNPISLTNSVGLSQNMVIAGTKFLYLPVQLNGSQGAVEAYTITHGSAALSAVAGSPFSTSQVDTGVSTTDPQGRFLFIAADAQIAVMQINASTGALTPAPGSPFSVSAGGSLAVDGTGNYLYVADGSLVFGFIIDQNTGALSPIPGSPFAEALSTIQGDPSGKFLVGVDALTAGMFVVTIEAGTGVLQSETMFPTTNAPYALALSPKGTSVFTFSADSKGNPLPLEGFQLDASGNATTLSGSPFTSLPNPRPGKFDQGGTHLVCPLSSSAFAAFTVDASTGAISNPLPNLNTITDFKFAITD